MVDTKQKIHIQAPYKSKSTVYFLKMRLQAEDPHSYSIQVKIYTLFPQATPTSETLQAFFLCPPF